MAANKFATMLHKNTHRISVILIYAVLEWILIVLLLLNSLFSYLITKFAAYFGLKPPCLWCSRVDKFFEPAKTESTPYRDLICEVHAEEISKLGYCSSHRKLAEAHDMCEGCSPSGPNSNGNSAKTGRSFDFFSWVEEMGKISNDGKKKKKIENGERSSRCSCCDVSLNTKLYTPYWLFKPSWEVLDYIKKGNAIVEATNDDDDDDGIRCSDPRKSVYLPGPRHSLSKIIESEEEMEDEDEEEEEEEEEEENEVAEEHQILPDVGEGVQVKDEEECLKSPSNHQSDKREIVNRGNIVTNAEKASLEKMNPKIPIKGRNTHQSPNCIMTQLYSGDNVSLEMLPAHLEKWSDHDDHFLVTIESIDSMTLKEHYTLGDEKAKKEHDDGKPESESQIQKQVEPSVDTSIVLELETEECCVKDQSNRGFTELKPKSEGSETVDQVAPAEATQTMPCNGDIVEATEVGAKHSNELPAPKENRLEALVAKTKLETFIEMEISDQELIDQPQVRDPISLMNCNDTQNSTTFGSLITENHQGAMKAGKVIIEVNAMPIETIDHGMNHHSSIFPELDKVEKEKALEIPNKECLTDLHKKFQPFEKKESEVEEFKYGSIVNDVDGGDGILTMEHLKSALAAERKVLNALYTELAAERSAAAIAANQTMVMITKLQEEKASIQMEALQYQRMMEEQSEYDQEALKLLNELMVKREKEKHELEKELEIYRKKVNHYEEKEKKSLRRKSNGRSTTSSTSCNSEDSDSFNDRQECAKQDTPADTIQNVDDIGVESSRHLSTLNESLADFEAERLAILEQLKALEEKLFSLDDDEDEGEFFEDIQPIESFSVETSKGCNGNYEFHSAEVNSLVNGFCKSADEEACQEKRNISDNAKRLLPLFDTIDMENEDDLLKEEQQGSVSLVQQNSIYSHNSTAFNKKLAIEEEVDHVYQRLQALEADREFLKHCIISLKKGDKGMDLLEEILQHLRDLKSVELRVRNMSDATLL